jgi:hypothetical protein
MAKQKVKSGQNRNVEIPKVEKPEAIEIRENIISKQLKWITSEGLTVTPEAWYLTKRNYIILVKTLLDNGSIAAISHKTGNKVIIQPEEIIYLKSTTDPGIPCGTFIATIKSNVRGNINKINKINASDSKAYSKYPHIINGSIYRVENTNSGTKIQKWERKLNNQKVVIKGQVRCRIKCQRPGCVNERDIKIQDAFQVRFCADCKKIEQKIAQKRKKGKDEQ